MLYLILFFVALAGLDRLDSKYPAWGIVILTADLAAYLYLKVHGY